MYNFIFSELLKGHKIEDALHEASMAKKLEAEAIQALKELQAGLQANLNSDAVSTFYAYIFRILKGRALT